MYPMGRWLRNSWHTWGSLTVTLAILLSIAPPAIAQAPGTRACFGLENIFPSYANNINLLAANLTQVQDAMQSAISSSIANTLSFLPAPSGGAFTYQLDPSLGVFDRTTESLGPIFSDRAETTGRGKFTFTASYSRLTFDSVDGVDARNGDLTAVAFAGCNVISSRFSQTPVATPFLDIFSVRDEIDADVGVLTFLYGVTDTIDVGITVPILSVSVKERVTRRGRVLCRPGTQVINAANCDFVDTNTQDLGVSSAESTGIGDISLRGKYNFWRVPDLAGGRFGMAAILDVKLPTGDEGSKQNHQTRLAGSNVTVTDVRYEVNDPPLGLGIVRVKPQLVASGSWFGFSPHVNVGVELGTTEGVTNDLVYAVGVDYTLFGRVTLVADLLGRHAFSQDRLRLPLSGEKADPDTLTGSFGLKANPFGTLIVFLNFLVPLNDTGLRDDIQPTIGVEWSF